LPARSDCVITPTLIGGQRAVSTGFEPSRLQLVFELWQEIRLDEDPQLRRRFYEAASSAEGEGGFVLLLDGRPVKTPALRALVAPRRAWGEALVAEWEAQRDVIDPAKMPLTRLEHDFLHCLVAEPGRVWTYQRLHHAVWGNEHLGHGSHIHSVVKRLRQKLAELGAAVTIHAVRGVGFHLLPT